MLSVLDVVTNIHKMCTQYHLPHKQIDDLHTVRIANCTEAKKQPKKCIQGWAPLSFPF